MKVKLSTSKGDITIKLNAAEAPISVENFLTYVDNGAYDGTIFHRVIDSFMIQGGAFEPDMRQRKGTDPIKNEWRNKLSNTRGTVAMARVGGNPDSASNQFFINVKDNPFLDQPQPDGAAYAVFGEVVDGMDVVDEIRLVETATRLGHENVPVDPIVIASASRVNE